MEPSAGLDGCGKSSPHRDSIPGTSSQERVTISTELSRPTGLPMKHILISETDKRYFSISERSDLQCIRHSLLFRCHWGAPFPGKRRPAPSSVEVTNKCSSYLTSLLCPHASDNILPMLQALPLCHDTTGLNLVQKINSFSFSF